RGGRALADAHQRTKQLDTVVPRVIEALGKHVEARHNFEDGDPGSIAVADDVLREINHAIGDISDHRHDGPDREKLLKLRMQLLDARDKAKAAHPPEKSIGDHVGDVVMTPVRFVERVKDGLIEYGKTVLDALALGGEAYQINTTGESIYHWDPVSKIG